MKKKLINKFFEGKCSPEEREQVERWLLDPDNENQVTALLKSRWDHLDHIEPPQDGELKKKVYGRLLSGMHKNEKTNRRPRLAFEPRRRGVVRGFGLKIAASVLIISCSLFVLYDVLIDAVPEVSVAEQKIVKQNPRGQKSTIILPDGSKVKLNSESAITYAQSFTRDVREIILSGEAFFEVKRDTLRPFRVITGDVIVTALGTSFNVNNFKHQFTEVSLATGKVKVETVEKRVDRENDLILLPGEQSTFKGDQLEKRTFDRQSVLAWRDGIIHFNGIEFEESLAILERWYDVKFKVINQPPDDLVGTGRFDNESLENVLNALSFSLHFQFTISENEVTIEFQ